MSFLGQVANIDHEGMSGNRYVVNNAVVFRSQAHDNTLPSTIMALFVWHSAFLEAIQKHDPSSTTVVNDDTLHPGTTRVRSEKSAVSVTRLVCLSLQ